MSRTDPSAATGQVPYPPSRCTCGHLVTLHSINEKGQRVGCTVRGVEACRCKVFVNLAAVAR